MKSLSLGVLLVLLTLASLSSDDLVLAESAPVTVDNAAKNPVPVVDVDNPARQPFTAVASNTGPGMPNLIVTKVPVGKRLVIESISVDLNAPGSPSRLPLTSLSTIVNGIGGAHWLPVISYGQSGGYTFYSGAYSLRMYADPDTNVTFFCPLPANGCSVSIYGFFVNIP
jgi:hypothetical protein